MANPRENSTGQAYRARLARVEASYPHNPERRSAYNKSAWAVRDSRLSPAAKKLALSTLYYGQVRMENFGQGEEPVIDVTNGFNHYVDTSTMEAIGAGLASRITPYRPDAIDTIGNSGPLVSHTAAAMMGLNYLVTKKGKPPVTFVDGLITETHSFTGNNSVNLTVSGRVIRDTKIKRVGLIDDVLANGDTVMANIRLLEEQADLTIVCAAFAFIKTFGNGWNVLREYFNERFNDPARVISLLQLEELTPEWMKVAGISSPLYFLNPYSDKI
ncbi:MAG: hypothetical protein U0525_03905 [Patescibacteria group bacterium]